MLENKKNTRSYTTLGKIYFWTASIHEWYDLLAPDENKQIIIDSLKYLSDRGFINVYAFVIMPTHIHLIWEMNKLNGKESPKASFLKYTGHTLLNKLKKDGKSDNFLVNETNKNHEIWQKEPLAIEIFSLKVAIQKLEYIHYNPVSGKWQLAKDDISYHYSSVRFYDNGLDEFGFLKNLMSVFTGN